MHKHRSKYIASISYLFAGFIVIAFGVFLGVGSNLTDNLVANLNKTEQGYETSANLSPKNNSYYLTASILGDSRNSMIRSASITVQSKNKASNHILRMGDSSSKACETTWFCKDQVLKSFSVQSAGTYDITVNSIENTGNIRIKSLRLHSNHSYLITGLSIITGLFLLVFGIVKLIKTVITNALKPTHYTLAGSAQGRKD